MSCHTDIYYEIYNRRLTRCGPANQFFFLIFYFETFLCVTENNTKHEVLLDKKKTNGTCLPREK